jgi:hypothetical protein
MGAIRQGILLAATNALRIVQAIAVPRMPFAFPKHCAMLSIIE